jgi:hypothetical protein
MAHVSLRLHRAVSCVQIRELAGRDEQAVESAATADAVRLIGGVLVESAPDRALNPLSLAAADRDRILAAIYQLTFGPRIDSTVHCLRCGDRFDLSFRLDDLANQLDRMAPEWLERCDRGLFRAPAGWRFRLPTAEEEIECVAIPSGDAARALAEKCILETAGQAPQLDELERAMEDAAPVLDLDLDARCPECGADQGVHFDIQSYLLNTIIQKRPRLWRDLHRIASAYHWSRPEILELPRSERRELVELIEAETPIRWRTTA